MRAMKSIGGFCHNSRRWIWLTVPRSCPYLGDQGNRDCLYGCCGYWEDKDMTRYARRKEQAIKSIGGWPRFMV